MKVTKIIREYITDSINAKFQPMIDAVNGKYAEIDKAFSENEEKARKEAIAAAREIFGKYMTMFYNKEEYADVLANYDSLYKPGGYRVRPLHRDAMEKEFSDINARRDKAIRSVLVELEMGATKKDIDRLLAEVIPEKEDA